MSRGHGIRQSGPKLTGQRPLRVGEEIRHTLSEILSRGDVRDPDLAGQSITVTEVRVSPDLKNATAFVMPLGGQNAAAILQALNRAASYLRGQVAHKINLRYATRIGFKLDESFDRASHIDAILRRADVAADLEADVALPVPVKGSDEA